MRKIQGLSGKIGVQHIIIFLVVISALMAGQFQAPWVARHAHDKIKIGMTGDEVLNALLKPGGYRMYCLTDLNGKNNPITDDDQCLATISSLPNQQQIKSVRMNLTFMGPVFWHNDFFITFGKEGKVTEVSPVGGRD